MPWNQNTAAYLSYPKHHIDFVLINNLLELTAPAFLVLEMYRLAILPQDPSVPVSIEIDGIDQGQYIVKDFRYPNSGDEVIHIAFQNIANSEEPALPSWMVGRGEVNTLVTKQQDPPWAILRLSIECTFGQYLEEPFIRIVELPTVMTLEDLHFFIKDELVMFDEDHLSGFFIANSWRGDRDWLTESDDLDFDEDRAWLRSLGEIFPLAKHKKLYYLFDFGDSWTFEIRKKGKALKPIPDVAYPRVIHEEGPMPEQYPQCDDF